MAMRISSSNSHSGITLDADPDLEPSLAVFSTYWQAGADECEIPEDDEPSLGSLDRAPNQERWSQGGDRWCIDAELDDCDREDDDPDELMDQLVEMWGES